MTGRYHNIRKQITGSTGAIPVLELKKLGKIVAIIDEDGIIRLLRRMGHFVQINLINCNHVVPLPQKEIDSLQIRANELYQQ